MATVIGIFQEQYIKKEFLTVVKPGNQSRKFTHIYDTIETCIEAWQKNKNRHYIIAAKKSYTVLEVAKMFNKKIKFVPKRLGERYSSSIVDKNFKNKIYIRTGKRLLIDYIKDFKESVNKN